MSRVAARGADAAADRTSAEVSRGATRPKVLARRAGPSSVVWTVRGAAPSPGPARDPAMARAGVGARDKPGHDRGGGGGDRSRAGTGLRDIGPRPPSRHGRACPGHPRRAEPLLAPDGPGQVRDPAMARAGVGARDKPGHDRGGGGGDRSRAGTGLRDIGPRPPSRHGRACPGHPRRAEPLLAPDGPGQVRDPAMARAGVGARDKPGHDGGGGWGGGGGEERGAVRWAGIDVVVQSALRMASLRACHCASSRTERTGHPSHPRTGSLGSSLTRPVNPGSPHRLRLKPFRRPPASRSGRRAPTRAWAGSRPTGSAGSGDVRGPRSSAR